MSPQNRTPSPKRKFTILGASLAATVASLALATAGTGCSQATEDHVASSTQAVVPASPGWAGWGSLGGGLTTDPALVAYNDNYVGAFATNQDLWFNWFELMEWQGWINLGNNGNALTSPPVAVVAGNHIEVFVQDTVSGFLLHKEGTFNGGEQPTWSGWESIWGLENAPGGGVATAGPLANLGRPPAVVVSQPNNQVNVVANFADGSTKAIKVFGIGDWSFWTNLGGGSHYEPGAVSWGANRLDVFVTGNDAQVYHQYSNDEGTTFNPPNWELVGGNSASAPSVVSWGPNRLDVFVSGRRAGAISGVEHLAWTGSSWGTCGAPPCWDSLHLLVWQNGMGGPMAPPVAITTGVGAINVFAQGIDEGLNTMAMTAADPPAWGDYTELTGCFRTFGAPAVISADGYNLDIAVTAFAANGDASVYANSTTTEFTAQGSSSPPACACGFPGGPCCWPDNGCNAYASCGATLVCGCDSGYVQQTVNGNATCVAIGSEGAPCLPNGTCSSDTLVCSSGTCRPCGATGGLCCSGETGAPQCTGSDTCTPSGTCQDCGGAGMACCANDFCASQNVCESGTCAPCGKTGQACCNSNACDVGLKCESAKCAAPPPCGSSGEACCTTGAACVSGLTCQSSKCEAPPPPPPPTCGKSGQACCASGSACTSGLTCQSGKCETPVVPSCGRSGQACCEGTCSSIELSCESNVCCTTQTFDVCVSCDGSTYSDVNVVACSLQEALKREDAALANSGEGSDCAAISQGPCF